MDDGSDRVRTNNWMTLAKAGIAAGLLVLLGAGCSPAKKPMAQEASRNESKTMVSEVMPATINQGVILDAEELARVGGILARSCITIPVQSGTSVTSTRWEDSAVYKFYNPLYVEGFHPDFSKAVQEKMDQGWKFTITCSEQGGPMLYFAMFKNQGKKNQIIIGTFVEQLDSKTGGLRSLHRFSDPVELQGDGKTDLGTITDLRLGTENNGSLSNATVEGEAVEDNNGTTYRRKTFQFSQNSQQLKVLSSRDIN